MVKQDIIENLWKLLSERIDFKIYIQAGIFFAFGKDRPLLHKSSKCFHTQILTPYICLYVAICVLGRLCFWFRRCSFPCFIYIYLFFSCCPLHVSFWIVREQHFKMTISFEFRYGTSNVNVSMFVHEFRNGSTPFYVYKWECTVYTPKQLTSCSFAIEKNSLASKTMRKRRKTNWLL